MRLLDGKLYACHNDPPKYLTYFLKFVKICFSLLMLSSLHPEPQIIKNEIQVKLFAVRIGLYMVDIGLFKQKLYTYAIIMKIKAPYWKIIGLQISAVMTQMKHQWQNTTAAVPHRKGSLTDALKERAIQLIVSPRWNRSVLNPAYANEVQQLLECNTSMTGIMLNPVEFCLILGVFAVYSP